MFLSANEWSSVIGTDIDVTGGMLTGALRWLCMPLVVAHVHHDFG